MLGSGQVVRFKLGCKHELPVQPDYHGFRATDHLNPIPECHDESPLAVATGSCFTERMCIYTVNTEFLKWRPNYGYTERTDLVTVLRLSQLPGFSNLPVSEPSKKPPCRVVFSF